jgi:2,4-dienoyl-CoA reductase-like NADH-dependent reductase (Old Yellow Enzyme family)
MQLAHAGLQTLPAMTGFAAMAPSVRRSPYFRATPVRMTESDVREVTGEFRSAAVRARRAGFDGVQLHAAHGYLIHQFLSPFVNDRPDRWGGSADGRFAFLREIVCAIKSACGDAFPVFVKLSVPDGHPGGVDVPLAIEYVRRMRAVGVEAVEISTGTMDQALNIFRGGAPIDRVLKHNMLFSRKPRWLKWLWKKLVFPSMRSKLIAFSESYNLDAAAAVRRATGMPVILVGGVRRLESIERVLESGQADAVALCRPLICEPDLGAKFRRGEAAEPACVNCNVCAVMADSTESLKCYRKGSEK